MPFRSLLIALILITMIGCGGPILVLPGGALSGEVVEDPPPDWSFASDAFVDLETRPSDPYSVELNYVVRDGALYVDPAEGREWLTHLRADPNVRVRFGNKVYLGTAVLVGEPGELEGFDPDRFVYRIDFRRP